MFWSSQENSYQIFAESYGFNELKYNKLIKVTLVPRTYVNRLLFLLPNLFFLVPFRLSWSCHTKSNIHMIGLTLWIRDLRTMDQLISKILIVKLTALSRHQINLTWNDCGDLNNLSNLEWRCWISVWVNTCGPGDPLLSDPPIFPVCNSSSFTLTMFTFGVFGLTIPM